MTEAELKQRYAQVRNRLFGAPPRSVVGLRRLPTKPVVEDDAISDPKIEETFATMRRKYSVTNSEILNSKIRTSDVLAARRELAFLLVNRHKMSFYSIPSIMGGNHTSAMVRYNAYLKDNPNEVSE